jgi:hypothetical protein
MADRRIGVAVLASATSLAACGGGRSESGRVSAKPSPVGSITQTGDRCDFSAYNPIRGTFESQVVREWVQPVFPSVAQIDHLEGLVLVDVLVDGQGNPLKACATRGPAGLRPASEEAALRWRFERLLVNGAPRPYVYTVSFMYKLRS